MRTRSISTSSCFTCVSLDPSAFDNISQAYAKITAFSNPEAAEDDKLVDGYTIPGKTDVIVDTYAINVENSYWHNPQEYDPYRHLGPKDQARRYNMWRFGFGPRQCLGKHVADIILRVIIAELLKRYEIILEEETGKDAVHLQIDSWIGLPSGRVRLLPRTN
ncbi:cytochrome p450 oxidoreductase [Paraphaeosphaeria sporulosa]